MNRSPLNFFALPKFEPPHPPISLAVLLVIEEAIRVAWQILIEHPPAGFEMRTAAEEELNHHLRETLLDCVHRGRLVEGFDDQQVSHIASGEEVRNYDGTELKKKPDI